MKGTQLHSHLGRPIFSSVGILHSLAGGAFDDALKLHCV